MINKIVSFLVILVISLSANAQNYYLGDEIKINSSDFILIGKSSKTGVSNYRYTRQVNEKMFEREIGDIIVGVKDGHIASTVYNLVPLPNDVGVPSSIIDLIQANLPFPMKNIDGTWGCTIDNNSISFRRSRDALTFGKDMISFLSTLKYSILTNK